MYYANLLFFMIQFEQLKSSINVNDQVTMYNLRIRRDEIERIEKMVGISWYVKTYRNDETKSEVVEKYRKVLVE